MSTAATAAAADGSSVRWTITVKTADRTAAGISGSVFLRVVGDRATLKVVELGDAGKAAPAAAGSKGKRSPFAQNVTSKFAVVRGDCGMVTALYVWHSGVNAWDVEFIEVQRGNDSWRFVPEAPIPAQSGSENGGRGTDAGPPKHAVVATGATRFHVAAKENNVEALEKMITANEFAIDERDKMGRTAAHYAALYGAQSALELLVEFQADVTLTDRDGMHCLHHAAKNHINTVEIVELLLGVAPAAVRDRESKAENPRSLASDQAAVEVFVRDRDGFGKTACHYAAAYGFVPLVQLLDSRCPNAINEADNTGLTPLGSAAIAGQTKATLCLLDLGAQPDQVDRLQQTFLHHAATAGHAELIQQVLGFEFSAPVRRALQQVVDLPDAQGRTPMLCAAAAGHLDCVKALYRAGANAYHVDADKSNALHLGARVGADQLLAYLAQKHDVNSVNDMEFTPLHVAVESGNSAAVRWLLKHGADVHAKLISGETPLDLAHQNKNETLVRALENALSLAGSAPAAAMALMPDGASGGKAGQALGASSPVQQLVAENSAPLVPPVPGTQPDPRLMEDNHELRHRVEHLQQVLVEKNRVISNYRARLDGEATTAPAPAPEADASAAGPGGKRSCDNQCALM